MLFLGVHVVLNGLPIMTFFDRRHNRGRQRHHDTVDGGNLAPSDLRESTFCQFSALAYPLLEQPLLWMDKILHDPTRSLTVSAYRARQDLVQ